MDFAATVTRVSGLQKRNIGKEYLEMGEK